MKKIVVAFYRCDDPNGTMTGLTKLSDIYYGKTTYVHCALIMREGLDHQEYTYHLDSSGPKREFGRTFGGTTMNTGWSVFKTIYVSEENYKSCLDWLVKTYEKYLTQHFEDYDPFMNWGLRIFAPRMVGCIESIGITAGCLPEKRWMYCADFVVSALRRAQLDVILCRDTAGISTQDLYDLLAKYNDSGPEDMEILKNI